MEKITKISETEYEKAVPQPDLKIRRTLDDLLAEQASLSEGIKNNQDRILEQQAKLQKVLAEIEAVKGLGVKTSEEIQVGKIEEADSADSTPASVESTPPVGNDAESEL